MNTDVSIERYAPLIERQKERLEAASMLRGEIPTDRKSPHELGSGFVRASKWIREKRSRDIFVVDSSIIAPYYAPSTVSPDRLTKLHIKDLQLETHHRGYYLLLTVNLYPLQVAGVVISIMRDETDDMIMTSHHYEIAAGLYQGAIFMIKEPYFTITSTGDHCVRVDHITDMIHMCPVYEWIPSGLLPQRQGRPNTTDDWKRQGDMAVKKKRYIDAAMAYTSAFECNPTLMDRDTVAMNRAFANLKIGSYDRVLRDLKALVARDHPPEKALYRTSQAQYNLGRFRHSLETLTKLLRDYPENKEAIREKARVEQRLVEQKYGRYDFFNMYDFAQQIKSIPLDHASYVGSVKVNKSEGRGLGLFTTNEVKAGDLLLCEKAFSYSYEEEKEGQSKDSSEDLVLANILTNHVSIGPQVSLLKKTIRKLRWNPSLLSHVTDLHHGSYVPVEETNENVIDTFLIYHILSLNTFGCPISSREGHVNGQALSSQELELQYISCGLWTTASRVNHSCFYNARRSFIGDLQIVRAACDMPPGTEITFLYRAVDSDESDFNRSSNSGTTQHGLKNWGFECTCVICTYRLITPTQTLQRRTDLLKELEMSFKHFEEADLLKAEKLLGDLERTYSVSAVELPRIAIWQPYLFVTRQYAERKKPEKTILTALNLLKALGFVIRSDLLIAGKPTGWQSHGVDSTNPVLFEVIKWGLVVDQVIEVFMHIHRACQAIKREFCGRVETVARTAYKICLGEDDTFWETYGLFYHLELPPQIPRDTLSEVEEDDDDDDKMRD